MGIEGEPPYRPPEKPQENEKPKDFLQEYEQAERTIEMEGVTTVEALDNFLRIGMEHNRAMGKVVRGSPVFDNPDSIKRVEYYGEQAVRFMRANEGTYTKEKATFCIGRAQTNKELADDFESGDWGMEEKERKATVQGHRRQAANWFRMTAVCLETDETS